MDEKEQLFEWLGIKEENVNADMDHQIEDQIKDLMQLQRQIGQKKEVLEQIQKDREQGMEFRPERYQAMIHEDDEKGKERKNRKEFIPIIGGTLIFVMLICYPFILIDIGDWQHIKLGIVVALCGELAIVLAWKTFIEAYRNCWKGIRQGMKYTLFGGLIIIGSIMIVIFGSYGMTQLQRYLFASKPYILCQPSECMLYFICFIEVELIIIFGNQFFYKWKFRSHKKRHFFRLGVVVVNVLFAFIAIVGVTVVTKNHIEQYSFSQLSGKEYSYDEIKAVDTGFNRKGDFYYKMIMKNGKIIEITGDATDQYEKYAILDRIVMKRKPVKETSTKYIGNSGLANEYLRYLKQVINNK